MPQRLHLPLLLGACGKRRYYDWREAEQARLELVHKQVRGDHKPGRLCVYECQRCQAYHVGHDRREVGG